MPRYTLVVKRKDIEYDISSEDRDLVQSQIDLLFATMKTCHLASHSSFAPTEVKLTRAKSEYVALETQSKNVDEQVKEVEKPSFDLLNKAVNTIEMEQQILEDEPVVEQKEEAQIEQQQEMPEEVIEEFTAKQEPEPVLELVIEDALAPAIEPSPQVVEKAEELENVVEKIEEPEIQATVEEPKPQRKGFLGLRSVFGMANKDKAKQVVEDFDSILEEKIQKPTLKLKEPETKSEDFDFFIKSKNSGDLLDYLIITAYYLYENDCLERFSLKQLNQKLFNSMKLAIDHKTVQRAIDEDFVRVVPDLTGIAGVTEYSLTQKGEDYYLKGFGS